MLLFCSIYLFRLIRHPTCFGLYVFCNTCAIDWAITATEKIHRKQRKQPTSHNIWGIFLFLTSIKQISLSLFQFVLSFYCVFIFIFSNKVAYTDYCYTFFNVFNATQCFHFYRCVCIKQDFPFSFFSLLFFKWILFASHRSENEGKKNNRRIDILLLISEKRFCLTNR